MRILLIHPREEAYDSRSVRDFPSGGTEKAFIFLGEAFEKLGHSVEWVTTVEDASYLSIYHATLDNIVITQQAEFLQHFDSSIKRIWWSHHFADQPITIAAAPWARAFADQVVTLSQCHHQDLKDKLKIESTVIGHGVWLDELETNTAKDPYRLIYASAPFRGLERIPELFRCIREREPHATIAICSSQAMYGRPDEDRAYEPLFDELAGIPGVELKGALNQADLYREYAKASIFFYPCIWPETYCIAMDEAVAHRCVPIVTNLGALPERAFYVKAASEDLLKMGLVDIAYERMDNPNRDLIIDHNPQPRDWLEVAKAWEKEVFAKWMRFYY